MGDAIWSRLTVCTTDETDEIDPRFAHLLEMLDSFLEEKCGDEDQITGDGSRSRS